MAFSQTFIDGLSQHIQDAMPNAFKLNAGALTELQIAFIDAIASALASAWDSYFTGITILPLPTLGGAGGSIPAPLTGVVSLMSPGMMMSVAPFMGVAAAYVAPTDFTTTTHVLSLLAALDATMPTIGIAFAASYLFMPLAMSGISGYVAGAPPVPGPYIAGPVTPGQTMGGGVSTIFPSKALMQSMIQNLMTAFLGPPFVISMWYTNSEMRQYINALSTGIAEHWFSNFMAGTMFTGGVPIGVCLPGGVVTGITNGIGLIYND